MPRPKHLLPQRERPLKEQFCLSVLCTVTQVTSGCMEQASGFGESEAILLDPPGTEQGLR